jgi:hypothetical protein
VELEILPDSNLQNLMTLKALSYSKSHPPAIGESILPSDEPTDINAPDTLEKMSARMLKLRDGNISKKVLLTTGRKANHYTFHPHCLYIVATGLTKTHLVKVLIT